MIAKYLKTTYRKGARGPKEYDCWGLVRAVRYEFFHRALLPELSDLPADDARAKTRAHDLVHSSVNVREVPMQPGAAAEAWIGGLCVHVGVVVDVDGMLFILETDTPFGPTLTKPSVFSSRYTKVKFYDDAQ